ncbi:hypothetical protein SAMN04487866_10945 [Thermoactinomyces sp. DSM 45891]|uniref:ParM/StbA family protein n=1 Tax=Thermoactinomyces sp. DSM 45891 TaxID=1761907 RepID=UPI0009114606|nr:ParM/StbA family protein [Thermoactinomyces sp. DSM 45891]SFX48338.1 hypothetical protein SAMN04487866_10945 [Thermoactinomyces sp. DSM 45891]
MEKMISYAYQQKQTKVLGFEVANSYVKGRSSIGRICYLNAVRERLKGEEVFGRRSKKSEDLIFGYGDSFYTVGDPMESVFSTARDIDRYSNHFYKLSSILAITQLVDDGDQIKVTTGVPANHYKNEQVSRYIQQALLGSHRVVVNGGIRRFEISDVEIILQPLGTLFNLMVNDDGSYTENGHDIETSRRKLIVDVGFGSTDVAVLDGMTLLRYFTLNYSMVDAYKRILLELGLTNQLKPLEIEQPLLSGDSIRYGGRIFEKPQVDEVKRKAFEILAQQIMGSLKGMESLDSFDYVIFTGGGVEALYEPLKSHLIGVPNAVKVSDSQSANSEGYYLYSLYT